MSKSNILALVEALREAGQREHGIVCDYGEAIGCPADACTPGPCECGADDHNAQVDAAAKTLVAEIEKQPCEKFPLKNPAARAVLQRAREVEMP